jgi:malonyl-CoA O-methyltransferase
VYQNLNEYYRVLNKGCYAVIATLGPASLGELQECFRQVDNYEHINKFENIQNLLDIAKKIGYEDISLYINELVLFHPNVLDIMQNLKKIGANFKEQTPLGGLFSRQKLNKLQQIYQDNYSDLQGLRVTWQVYLLIIRKK